VRQAGLEPHRAGSCRREIQLVVEDLGDEPTQAQVSRSSCSFRLRHPPTYPAILRPAVEPTEPGGGTPTSVKLLEPNRSAGSLSKTSAMPR